MYSTIKKGSTGDDVKLLCRLLHTTEKTTFDDTLDKQVRNFQRLWDLDVDGIVGWNSWKSLMIKKKRDSVTEEDYQSMAELLGIETAALKAVIKVETGGGSGFEKNGNPKILFEAHRFYSNLKKAGLNPDALQKSHPNIISPSWNKNLYKGGTAEWARLEEARSINATAANKSASWGLWQIMGENFENCNCKTVQAFVDKMCASEYDQLLLGVEFLRKTGLVKHLQTKQWALFAKGYNGAGYAANKYDQKLATAYESYK